MSYFARRGAAFVLGVAVVGLAAGVIHDATGDDPTTDRASLTPAEPSSDGSTTSPGALGGSSGDGAVAPDTTTAAAPAAAAATTTSTTPFVARTDVLVDPASFAQPYSSTVP